MNQADASKLLGPKVSCKLIVVPILIVCICGGLFLFCLMPVLICSVQLDTA